AAGREADHLADIFSLGVVLFRLLTGHLPFEGETSMEVLTALATKTPPLASEYNPDLPKSLVELVQRMLSRDTMARPSSTAEVARFLEGIEKFVLAPPPPPKKSRRTLLITIGVVAAMMMATFGAVWFSMHGGESDDVPVVGAAATNKVLTPAEAVHAVGDHVTVEFTVGAVRKADGIVYVYEQPPPAKVEETIFRVVLPGHVVSAMRRKSGTPWPDSLNGALLRVQGTVLREGRFAELLVSEVEQFDKILYKDRKDPNAKSKGGENDKSISR